MAKYRVIVEYMYSDEVVVEATDSQHAQEIAREEAEETFSHLHDVTVIKLETTTGG